MDFGILIELQRAVCQSTEDRGQKSEKLRKHEMFRLNFRVFILSCFRDGGFFDSMFDVGRWVFDVHF